MWIVGELLFEVGKPLVHVGRRAVNAAVMAVQLSARFVQPPDLLSGEPAAAQSHAVDLSRSSRIAFHYHVWRHVVKYASQSTHEGVLPDRGEVVASIGAFYNDMILNVDVSSQKYVVGHDHMVAQLAVVRDMYADHNETVAADTGNAAALDAADMHSHALADDVVVTYQQLGRIAFVAEVLRISAECRVRPDDVVDTCSRMPGHYDMADQSRARADTDIGADTAEGSDVNVVSDLRAGFNN